MQTVVIMVILAIFAPGLCVPFSTSRGPTTFNFSNQGDPNSNRRETPLVWDESHAAGEGSALHYRDQFNGDQESSPLLSAAELNEEEPEEAVHDTDDDTSFGIEDNDGDNDDEDDDDDDYDRESEGDDDDDNDDEADSDEFAQDHDQLPTNEATADSTTE